MMAAVLPVDGEGAVDVQAIARRMREGVPPRDVQEYLWRVRLEAESIPDVVVAENVDPRRYDTQQTSNMPSFPSFGSAQTTPAERLPTDSWKRELLADFAELRQLISRWEAVGAPKAAAVRDARKLTALRTQVPRMKDEDGWRAFCLGKTNADASPTPPHLRLLLQFDQVLTRRLLDYHVAWLDDSGSSPPSRAHAVWIYALLARLDKPMHSVVAATIRQLLRRCWTLRGELETLTETQLKTLNILIALSGDFFGQLHELE